MYLAIGERFGTVQVIRMLPRGAETVWKSVQLSGVPREVICADLDGDTLDDALICRTSNAKIYVWSLEDLPPGLGVADQRVPDRHLLHHRQHGRRPGQRDRSERRQ